ncbi:hypothetical protein KKH13_04590 [Patescibacteria group bacterium]|nr:hypothetical protein [Patescibacteria group bacterium]
MQELIEASAQEAGISLSSSGLARSEIVFHNRQRIGDMLMFTCAVRDFKAAYPAVRVNVIATAMHIFDNNPAIDRTLLATPENTLKIGPGRLTNSSNRIDWHFANAYRVSIEDALGIHIPQGESRPDIWFTQEEYDAPRITDKPYWIIVVNGEKGWGCKMYPTSRWQQFIDQNPDITFYQVGTNEDNPPRLQGPNVVDFVGKTQSKETGIRDLFKLFLHAEGSIGLVSFHMHLSGALKKPCVVVAGGREPVHFTRYPGHQYLANDGCLPCSINACWHCDIKACPYLVEVGGEQTPKCVDLITPEDLTRALNAYYQGGRLTKGKPSDRPKLKNVVPTPVKVSAPVSPSLAEIPTEALAAGLSFGGGSLTAGDWTFIQGVIKDHNIKSVLEFGAGLSTILLNKAGMRVVTFETNQGWIDKLKKHYPSADVRLWDGVNLDLGSETTVYHFDFAFVDGPSGGASREASTKIAAAISDIVIIHDAGRENERKWQDLYVKDRFTGPGKGGNRCHLWVKKEKQSHLSGHEKIVCQVCQAVIAQCRCIEGHDNIQYSICDQCNKNPYNHTGVCRKETMPQKQAERASEATIASGGGKFIKVVSTARGWGGCARSITTIMKLLLAAGHRVEFIPFRNSVGSREFKECLSGDLKNVVVTENYSSILEACDVLFVYGDDYIWEFGTPEVSAAFSEINAKRKIMMLNYRRGKVGEIPWTRGWDKYMFLNKTQEDELLRVHPGVPTKVLPPCTDLTEFLKIKPFYQGNLRIVRHSSQGDTKYSKEFQHEVFSLLVAREDAEISLMPAPSWLEDHARVHKMWRNVPPVPEFLATGNLFWYSLPQGYMDMGPRVILESMAAGLPVMADAWGGAVDRVTPECGWLVKSKDEYAEIIKNLTPEELEEKGKAAKARALAEFVPENYLKEIIGNE